MLNNKAENMLENMKILNGTENNELKKNEEELIKRWEEMASNKDKDRLLKELEKLSEQLKKEDLLDKMDQLSKWNRREEKSLERLVELTKQFYVEKKTLQIEEKLKELAEEQFEASEKVDMNVMKQEEI